MDESALSIEDDSDGWTWVRSRATWGYRARGYIAQYDDVWWVRMRSPIAWKTVGEYSDREEALAVLIALVRMEE
jgi:hypothetical protein